MSLATPSKIRELQIKLYRKAKNEPGYRFYMLYDKIYREDILAHAYARARANNGAPGVDGQSFAEIESGGVGEWLTGIREELRNKTYEPQPVRRKMLDPSSTPPNRKLLLGGNLRVWQERSDTPSRIYTGSAARSVGGRATPQAGKTLPTVPFVSVRIK